MGQLLPLSNIKIMTGYIIKAKNIDLHHKSPKMNPANGVMLFSVDC